MSLQNWFVRGLAIIALTTAANSFVTSARADSEDIWNTYQTSVASPAVQAAAAVNTPEHATKTDAAAPALSGGHKGNEIYDEIFQPGNPETLLNTK